VTSREWIEKDYYKELGVSSSASTDEIKKAYRKLAKDNHPDTHPGDTKAENKFKAVSEAYNVLSDEDKRKEYDEARTLFGGGGGFRPSGGGFGQPGGAGGFDLGDLFGGGAGEAGADASGGLGDILGGLFGRRGGTGASTRPRRGQDVETEIRIDFTESVHGATVPLRLASPASCGTCRGSGAKPGTSPRSCATCRGSGTVSSSQGAFAFSEPCRDCRGTGRIVDNPCPECGGSGVSTKARTLTVRIPPGVRDGQQIRLAGQGEPGQHGGPAGDLYVKVNVTAHQRFGRSGNDLTITVPVTFPELVLGTTLSVPTLDSSVTMKVPAGTSSGRTLRARGKGIAPKSGKTGDLLVTLSVAVPNKLDKKAKEALEAYQQATAGYDPRAELDGFAAAASK
jgi:molecular chaperone DnaJ